MYDAQTLSTRIRKMVKEKGFVQKEMLRACDLNENSLNQMSDKKGLSSFSLAKIADYLDVSVDFLLGRTDNPNITNSISNTNTTVNGTQANVINSNNYNQETVAEQTDEMTRELLKAFKALPFKDKMDIMNAVMKKSER